jgi:hypothetical protein
MLQQQSLEALAGISRKRDHSEFILEVSGFPSSEQIGKLEEQQTGPTRCELKKTKPGDEWAMRCWCEVAGSRMREDGSERKIWMQMTKGDSKITIR